MIIAHIKVIASNSKQCKELDSSNCMFMVDFKNLCYNLNAYQHLHIPSPSYQKRRAAVAAIIRCHTVSPPSIVRDQVTNLDEFFEQDWVKHGKAEILFMQRASRAGDRYGV